MCNRILQQIAATATAAAAAPDTTEHEQQQRQAHDIGVSYIDTDFITGPVWDSAEDWSHYNGEEGSQEIKYILSEILKA